MFYYSRIADAADHKAFFDAFERSFLARKGPEEMALFAVEREDVPGGFAVHADTFTAAPEVKDMRSWTKVDLIQPPLTWALLIGHSDAAERYGVTLGTGRQSR